jgi:hypothetical protein
VSQTKTQKLAEYKKRLLDNIAPGGIWEGDKLPKNFVRIAKELVKKGESSVNKNTVRNWLEEAGVDLWTYEGERGPKAARDFTDDDWLDWKNKRYAEIAEGGEFSEQFKLASYENQQRYLDSIRNRAAVPEPRQNINYTEYGKARLAIRNQAKIILRNKKIVKEAAKISGIPWENTAVSKAHKQYLSGYTNSIPKRIRKFKAEELHRIDESSGAVERTGKLNTNDTRRATEWWDNLTQAQKDSEVARWARRDIVFFNNMENLLSYKGVSNADALKFLESMPELHHFDRVIGGSDNIDKYFSSGFVNKDLHNHIHWTGRAEKLNRRMKLGGLMGFPGTTGKVKKPIEGYNLLRSGDFPPWFTRVVGNFYNNPQEAQKVLDDIKFTEIGPIGPHPQGSVFAPDKTRNLAKLLRKGKESAGALKKLRVGSGPLSLAGSAIGLGLTMTPWEGAQSAGEGLITASDPLGSFVMEGWDMDKFKDVYKQSLFDTELDRKYGMKKRREMRESIWT